MVRSFQRKVKDNVKMSTIYVQCYIGYTVKILMKDALGAISTLYENVLGKY